MLIKTNEQCTRQAGTVELRTVHVKKCPGLQGLCCWKLGCMQAKSDGTLVRPGDPPVQM